MHSEAREAYLENQVLSAPPQRLRLMLIEGAQRFARQTLQHWQMGEHEAGLAALGRARSVVTELMSSIQPDGSPLARRVASLYLFLFHALAEAAIDENEQQVREALEILDIERETWRLVCEQTPQSEPGGTSQGDVYQSVSGPYLGANSAGTASATKPALPDLGMDNISSNGGLLFEA